jgi:hypothetical protein
MAEETNTSQAIVDETPISPVRPDNARKNSLENHLMHRPNRAELVESENPPPTTTTPSPIHQHKPASIAGRVMLQGGGYSLTHVPQRTFCQPQTLLLASKLNRKKYVILAAYYSHPHETAFLLDPIPPPYSPFATRLLPTDQGKKGGLLG